MAAARRVRGRPRGADCSRPSLPVLRRLPAQDRHAGCHRRGIGSMKPAFVAGFGPIVSDTDASRAFWGEALGIKLEEASPGYWTNDDLDGVKAFALWPLSQAAEAAGLEADGRSRHVEAPGSRHRFAGDDHRLVPVRLQARHPMAQGAGVMRA